MLLEIEKLRKSRNTQVKYYTLKAMYYIYSTTFMCPHEAWNDCFITPKVYTEALYCGYVVWLSTYS